MTEAPAIRSSRASDVHRARSRCVPWWRVLAIVWGPVLVAGVVAKALRIAQQDVVWWKHLFSVAPDLLFGGGLGVVVGALLWATHATPLRAVTVIVTQLLALVTFAVQIVAFGYFRATGLVLDYAMFRYSLSRVEETAPVVSSEINLVSGTMLALVPLWIIVAPWLVGRTAHAVSTTPRSRRHAMRIAIALATAGGCFVASFHIALPGIPTSIVREPVSHLISGFATTLGRATGDHVLLPPPRRAGPKRVVTTDTTQKYNVVVIVLESTRADATTPYKPQLPATPFLAALAESSTRVERAYAIVPHTSKALVAILCGIEPRPSLEIVEATTNGLPAHCLARLLAGVGYDTAFFQAPTSKFENRAQLVKNMGYARFFSGDKMPKDGFARINYFGFEDAIILGPSEQWLKTRAREPFLATYLTSASHHPYTAPPSHQEQQLSFGKNNRYLNAVNYVDSVVERIVQQYKDAGLYDRTMFVVVGDHGEGFGEHKLFAHDDVLYEEGVRVPLLFRVPSRGATPRTVPGPVNQLSIAPTILGELGLRGVDGRYEGKSIFADNASAQPIYVSCYRNAQCLGLIRDHMKLLYFFNDAPTLLFDLNRDPAERTNIAASQPDTVARWTEDLTRWSLAVDEMHKASSTHATTEFVTRTKPKPVGAPLHARFGTYVEAVSCSAKRRKRSDIRVSCQLHVLSKLTNDFRLRVHGTAGGSRQVFDHKPVRGLYPTRDWNPGEYITDTFYVHAPGHWERKEVHLCLELHGANGRPVPLVPPNADNPTCLQFAVVPPREARR